MWPEGNYALPTSIYGCNDPEFDQWQHGYINISFMEPVLLFERSKGHIHIETPSLLLGPYGPRSLQLNFCVKVSEEADPHAQVATEWPPGQYAVYGSEKGCPKGKTNRVYDGVEAKTRNIRLVLRSLSLLRGLQNKVN